MRQHENNKATSYTPVFNIKIVIIGVLLFFVNISFGAEVFDHSHAQFDDVLKKYNINGYVNYKALSNDRTGLTLYLKKLSSVKVVEYRRFSHAQQMAFLINAYNAFTLELILNNYPVKSIGDIGGPIRSINLARGTPWKIFKFQLLEGERDLNWIEHAKLRVDFSEPRIHFAINCASIGCPVLRKESYKAKLLEKQLQDAFQTFLRDTSKNKYNKQKNTLEISRIFDWFKADFENKSGSVLNFIKPAFSEPLPENVKIEYTDYDWSLNAAD